MQPRRRSSSSTASTSSLTTTPSTVPSSDRQLLTLALTPATESLHSALTLANSAQREVERLTALLEGLSPPSSAPSIPSVSSPVSSPSFPSYHPLYLSDRSLCGSTPLFSSGFLRLGEFVQIALPKGDQQSHGIVCASQGQFCLVRTPNGHRVRRFESNLRFVSRGSSPPFSS